MPPRAITIALWLCATSASATQPLSAIDWLEALPAPQSEALPSALPSEPTEPKKSSDASAPKVDVLPLDAPSLSGVGLLSHEVTGLPLTLWEGSKTATLQKLLEKLPEKHPLPAAQSLVFTLLLAEANPPIDPDGAFLSARIDALVSRGALGPARELLRLIPEENRGQVLEQRARLGLLSGDMAAICEEVVARPSTAMDAALRIYCLAQIGKWAEAATTLEVSHALADVSDAQYHRLLRYLDPELAETLPELPPPAGQDLSALDYRLLKAVGDSLPSRSLPLPFSAADLNGDSGWRAQMEAAERLVRAGAIGPAQLFGAYVDQVPAASGGVWDRAKTVQRFEAALGTAEASEKSLRFDEAWQSSKSQGLAVAFAGYYAPRLHKDDSAVDWKKTLIPALLLSPKYEESARAFADSDTEFTFEIALAKGAPTGASDARALAIESAWTELQTPPELEDVAAQGRLGEALLMAIDWLNTGAEGDLKALKDGLSSLRALGLEDTARRAALQIRLGGDTLR